MARWGILAGHWFPYAEVSPTHEGDDLLRLEMEHPYALLVAVYVTLPSGRKWWLLYSRQVDVGALAKEKGGWGTPHEAGFIAEGDWTPGPGGEKRAIDPNKLPPPPPGKSYGVNPDFVYRTGDKD